MVKLGHNIGFAWRASIKNSPRLRSWNPSNPSSTVLQAGEFCLNSSSGTHLCRIGSKTRHWLSARIVPCQQTVREEKFRLRPGEINSQLYRFYHPSDTEGSRVRALAQNTNAHIRFTSAGFAAPRRMWLGSLRLCSWHSSPSPPSCALEAAYWRFANPFASRPSPYCAAISRGGHLQVSR
jgi:hypothetical protein